MGRKRTELGASIDAEIATRTARGESAETIARVLGGGVAARTIRRRQAEMRVSGSRGPLAAAPNETTVVPVAPIHPKTIPDIEDVPDEPPAGASLEQLDRWIARLEVGASKAEEQGNLAALASIAQRVTALAALRHRITPMPKADLNEHPDYRALAESGEALLLQLARELFQPQ